MADETERLVQADSVREEVVNQQSMESIEDSKQQLYDILISDEYSTSEEITVPVTKQEVDGDGPSWILDLLEMIFGSIDQNVIYVLSLILKGLLILGLLLVVYWIVKNADRMSGWFANRQWQFGKFKVEVDDYRHSHLAQGWESLPPHDQIPKVVKQLLDEGQTLPASSILYRGSLRWLNDSLSLGIRPANTEMQCVSLIKKIEKSQNLSQNTADYVVNIINHWIPIAYAKQNMNGVVDTEQDDIANLHSIVTNWHTQLSNQGFSTHQSKSSKQAVAVGEV